MKIDHLSIRSKFKNLSNFTIDFEKDNLMTVIVGRNGSGKSNILEALVTIFRNLDLGESPPFSYELKYRLGSADQERSIRVDADPERGTLAQRYQIYVEHSSSCKPIVTEEIPLSKIKRNKRGESYYLPNFLFAYYSGPSDRLENHFRKHRDNFYRKMLNSEIDLGADIRPLFYAKPFHSQFVLLAFFLSRKDDKEKKFLRRYLGIEELDSVHFVMRKPGWARKKDELFWGASGVVRQFLDSIYPHALAPIKITRQEETSLTGRGRTNEFFHLFLPNVQSLRTFAVGLNQDVFFKMLESTLLSEIISEVSVRVRVSSSDEPLRFRELSEGEQQLLTVLGLLKFTGGKDSLFLLDEPDTHLNPLWTIKYLTFLKQFVPNSEACHLLMVTHHPLAIAELEKEQVQITRRDNEGQVHAESPLESPRGMGYAGILTSDMFGLQGTLDNATEDILRRRRELIEKENLTIQDKKQLGVLNDQIEKLGFTTAHWDNDYREYLRARNRVEAELYSIIEPTPEMLRKRFEKSEEIIREILDEEIQDGSDS